MLIERKSIKSIPLVIVLSLFSTHALAAWEALPEKAPAPADNPTTAEKVELGKMLYFDPRFSETGTVSCFSCHNVMEGGDDHRSVSIGVHGKKGGRNAPTVWNAAFLSSQFWDGRAATLEEQAVGPVVNPVEMGMASLDDAIDRIRAIPGYQQHFDLAFGPGNNVTMDNAAKAIAAYERTLITPNSPFDQYVNGDKTALSAQAIRGMDTFENIGCTSCHSGATFSGPAMSPGNGFLVKFPALAGTDELEEYDLLADEGRYVSTGNEADKNVWRVPTLRNLDYTAPYFHNGKVKSLDVAIRIMAKAQLNQDLSDEQVADIGMFLASLTGEFPTQTMPRLPPAPGDLLD
jgi:cytochrome c peroxidase